MKKNGFTILEILVVLAVLAILIAMAVPRIKGMQDQSNISRVKSELKTLQTALESYYINNGVYPTLSGIGSISGDLVSATPKIIPGVMYDPFAPSGTDYSYAIDDNGVYYVIFSFGLDGEADITSINTSGAVQNKQDDYCVTNGSGC